MSIQRFILCLALAFFFAMPVFARSVIVRNMRVQNAIHTMRVTFTLSSITRHHSFMLRHPDRFVVDLKNTKTFQSLHFSQSSSAFINSFKYATHRDGVFRMVFGLNNPAKPILHTLFSKKTHLPELKIIFQRSKKIARHTHLFLPPENTLSEKAVLSDASDDQANVAHRNIIVVIDPGHGGKDPGATGPGGTHEKNVVLSISKQLQQWINKQPGFHAVLTRTGDYYLTLRQRLRIARKDKADMFIAIHADTWRNKMARGVSVFALSQRGATSEAARWLATRENASELMGGVELQDKSHLLKSVLINLSQSATIRSSLQIGNYLLQTIKPIARLHHDRVEQAAFVVLKSPDIPSLLVETGFLSNPCEENLLRSHAYRNEIAESIMQGVKQYFTHYPPRNTWLSYWRNSKWRTVAYSHLIKKSKTRI